MQAQEIRGKSSRPIAAADSSASEAIEAVQHLVQELQMGWDEHDADVADRHLAEDVMWGSPRGETLRGFESLHAAHVRLKERATGGLASRYEIIQILVPAPTVAVAHVRRISLDPDGQPLEPTADMSGSFSEVALYVLVKREGAWWLAAGQNTPIRPSSSPSRIQK